MSARVLLLPVAVVLLAGCGPAPVGPDAPLCSDPAAVPGACVQEQLPEERIGRADG
jgi:hypothetical protein